MTHPSEPENAPEPNQLRFLRLLVTTLTVVMIVGLVVVVSLLVIRLTDKGPSLPGQINLPAGVTAEAVTMGTGWIAIVSDDQKLLFFDATSGALFKTVDILAE